jgi:L-2-hydroxyglutarate oxidase
MTETSDYLIVGGGIIGLNLALVAKTRNPRSTVVLIEKEPSCGFHASGRNSGVLHAGFYYTADSLKARFTRDGCKRLTDYCLQRGLQINQNGKLVVARDEGELGDLDELFLRGKKNGVQLEEISAHDARKIEPRARTYERALYSPSTAAVDPSEVVRSFLSDAISLGVQVRTDTEYIGRNGNNIRTSRGSFSAGYVINAAGVYADTIARDFGFAVDYRILPFKGLYLYQNADAPPVRTAIYPVPDLEQPFLGVHLTVTVGGRVKLGPTATPAFWKEHYRGVANFRLAEMSEVVSREALFFLRNDFSFRRLAVRELQKYSRSHMVRAAGELAEGLKLDHFSQWGRPGIRAQLVDIRQNKLVMDFCYEADENSFHVLNSVSPAFTCALPFTEYIFDQIENSTG